MSDERCDKEVYENGRAVAVVADRSGEGIEELVKKLSAECGVKMDWYYVAGRGVVNAIGDLPKARNSFRPYTNRLLKIVEEDGTWTE